MTFEPRAIDLGDNVSATVSEINGSTVVEFSTPEHRITQYWLTELNDRFRTSGDRFLDKADGKFSVTGSYGEKMCNILNGHDKGGDGKGEDNPPSPSGGRPSGGNLGIPSAFDQLLVQRLKRDGQLK